MLNLFLIFFKLSLIAEILNPYGNFINGLKIVRLKRSLAIKDRNLLWNEGIIPYEMDDSFTGWDRRTVKGAMQKWEKSTCLQFVERNHSIHPDYLALTRLSNSQVGKTKSGKNEVYLGQGCLSKKAILHELGHVIGFHHEQNRPDRDEHVVVNMNNVRDGFRHNFNRLSSEKITTFNQKYDYNSIMHYGRHEFSIGQTNDTIVPLITENNEIERIGTGEQLSETDVVSTNLLYMCPECGRTLLNTTGTFGSSIASINLLTNTVHCQWRIKAARGERIVITITSLSIFESKDCTSDYLEIKDEYSPKNSYLARLCGKNKLTQPIISSDSRVLVTYHANQFSSQYNGFTASYYKICRGDIEIKDEGQKYYLESPNYPNFYEANKNCLWRLVAPPNWKILIKFDYFRLEVSPDCKNDFLEIKNGSDYNSPLIETYCEKSPGEVLSEKNELFVKFVTNGRIEKRGFTAIITMIK